MSPEEQRRLRLVRDEPDTRFRPGESPTERCTDLGNARRLVRQHGHRIRYCGPTGTWYVYTEGRWRPDDLLALPQMAKATVQRLYGDAATIDNEEVRKAVAIWAAKSEAAARLEAMVNVAKSEPGTPIKPDLLDAHPHLLNLENGTLDLRDQTLAPHNPADLLTTKLGFDYDPDATAPAWRAFLHRVFAGQQDMIDFVQRAVGYSLTGTQGEQCFFFLYGGGANGKSVFLNTLLALFGEAGHMAAFSTFLRQPRGGSGPRGDLARLAGARLVTATEAGDGQRFDEELLKQITGGERITVRALYSSEIEFTPQLTLWLAANHRPAIKGADLAIWRRVCLIPFMVTIPEEERDANLLLNTDHNPLRRELPGILNWALDGYRAWRKEGLNKPAAVLLATEEYREDSDTLSDFVERFCDTGTSCRSTAAELYTSYKAWCGEVGEDCASQKWFGGRLRERGYAPIKSGGLKVYVGIAPLSRDDRTFSLQTNQDRYS